MYKGGYTPDNPVIQNFWKVNNEIGIFSNDDVLSGYWIA
jgi:hypothetical protein